MEDKIEVTGTGSEAENASIMEDNIDADVLAQNRADFDAAGDPTNPEPLNDADQAYVDCIKDSGSSDACAAK